MSKELQEIRKQEICPNCNFELSELDNFCAHCGQENDSKKATFGVLAKEFAGDYFVYDSKLIKSLIPLIFRPGFLTQQFIEGKRATYIKPIRLYLFISVLYFFMASVSNNISESGAELSNKANADSVNLSFMSVSFTKSELIADVEKAGGIDNYITENANSVFEEIVFRQNYRFFKYGGKGFLNNMIKNMSYVMFALLPILAFLVFLLFRKPKLFYLEHLVFSLHLHSFIFLINSIYLWLISYIVDIAFTYPLLIMLIYTILSLKKVFNYNWKKTFFRAGVTLFIYNALLLFSFIGVLLISFYLY